MANTAINIFGNSGEAMVGVDTLNDIIAGKQATLVSGTNIKTVNGNTLLGSGDVELTASDVGALPDNTVIPTGIEAADPADGTWTINLSNGNTITMDLNHTHPQYQPLLTAGTNISIAEDNQTGDLVISATGGGDSGNVGNLNTNNTSALTVSSSESFSGNISLHKISKTGSYNDLNNQPPIPSASTITPLMDGTAAIGSSSKYAKEDHVHPSDTSKQDKPIEFISWFAENFGQFSEFPTTEETARTLTTEELAAIQDIRTNKYNWEAYGTPAIGYWESDAIIYRWITPFILGSERVVSYAELKKTNDDKYWIDSTYTNFVFSKDLAAVATSGSYNDLSNKPTIPDVSNLAQKTFIVNITSTTSGDTITYTCDKTNAEIYAAWQASRNILLIKNSDYVYKISNLPSLTYCVFSGVDYDDPSVISDYAISTYNNVQRVTEYNIPVQEYLISGTNIKTINNQSLLGSGNLTASDVGAITRFVVDFTLSGTTISNPNKTFSEIKAAYDAGNLVLARDDIGSLYYLLYCENTDCGFFCSDSGTLYTIDVDSSNAWTYRETNISQLELDLSDKSQIIYMQKVNNVWKKVTYNNVTGAWLVDNTALTTGNTKNIYLDIDNNDLYYWNGSAFILLDEDNVQPDWNQNDSTKADYIKNKPTIPNSIKVGSVAGKLYRNNVAGSGNFTVTGNSGCIPNLTAGTFLVSIYAKSATQSYTFRFNFGSSVTYDLSTTNGEISDVRQITIPSNGTFSGLVLNGSVASGTILYVVMYNYLTPISTVGPAAVTNRYSDLDGTPTIPTVNNGTLTIKNHGVTVCTFTANQSGNTTADITTEVVTVSGTGSITQALDANKFYKFGSVSALTLTLNAAGSGLAIYAGKFTASANNISITLPSGTSITDSSVDIESGNTYEFSILDGVCIISDITIT
jgi:hypothetical protein